MKAVILAAGMGKRMDIDFPKCLLKVGGLSILERLVISLRKNNVNDITVIIGYCSKLMRLEAERLGINYLVNPVYSRTNNIFSLYMYFLDNSFIQEPILIISGDLLVKDCVIKVLVENSLSVMVLMLSFYLDNDSMRISFKDGIVVGKNLEDYDAGLVPIVKISDPEKLREFLYKQVNSGQVHNYVANVYRDYFSSVVFSALIVTNEIEEIDTIEDLEHANKVLL